MKENSLKFKRLKDAGKTAGFLAVKWDTSEEGIVTRICFYDPQELETV